MRTASPLLFCALLAPLAACDGAASTPSFDDDGGASAASDDARPPAYDGAAGPSPDANSGAPDAGRTTDSGRTSTDAAARDASSPDAPATEGGATGTWLSGASGQGVADGTFATWRGSPTPIAATWNDGDQDAQQQQYTLFDEFGAWQGDIDDTLGAFWGGSWAQAAQGAYTASWTTAVQNMAKAWSGKSSTVYIRLAHEMNGDWYDWKVTPADVADFKTAWQAFAGIVRANFPSAKIVFGANNGTSGGNALVPDIWPGDAYVDVVGVDVYDMWPHCPDEATWDALYMQTDGSGSPHGLGTWLAFAAAHGKPLGISEWGLNGADDGSPGPKDNPFFIQKMNAFFRANAGSGPGQLLYESYYNINDVHAQLYPVADDPNGSAAYRSLVWGN